MKQERFLTLAKKVSEKSDHPAHKMGCVIAKGNKVLTSGFNVIRTHPKSPHSHKSIHAEFMAAISVGKNVESLKGSTAYVFRQQKNGTWAMARPCKYCWRFLLQCGIKEVVYSFEGAFRCEEL